MVQATARQAIERHAETTARPRIWGLHADQLHDAFWRAHGVQCIRRGRPEPVQSGADLFLLLEPDQLVHFDVVSLAERLAWRAAGVTRLRVVDHRDDPYGEQLELDDEGHVRSIRRRYRHRKQSAYRVILTRKRRFAKMWMQAQVRRAGWRRISQTAGLTHTDNMHCKGGCFSSGNIDDESRLLDRLVRGWPRPDRVIDGIRQAGPGVWIRHGDELAPDSITIGPAWLGRSFDPSQRDCVIGPTWMRDEPPADAELEDAELEMDALPIRNIRDVDPGEAPPNEKPVPHNGFAYAVAKRGFDIVVSASALFVLSPLFALLAACIYFSDGRPIFYSGLRQTRGGASFKCWKFRSMYKNADEIKQTLASQNAADGPQFFMENDPRVLRIGHFLRRYHLDELPQLWNVLVGQMSLVGPRPSPDNENQKCPAWREVRLSVRPGITGLWQLRRTREPGLDFQEWIRYDFEYVEQASFWLDLKIFFATFGVVLGKGLKDASDKTR